MLSGEILIRSPLSVAILPPPSLIQVCKAMAAIATLASSQNIDDDDIFLENGLLSYENPNYHMDPQRMERNSHLYEEILSELHNQQSSLTTSKTSKSHIVNNRKDYARIDIGSMGVDLKENFSASEKQLLFDSSPTESKTKSDQIPEKDEKIIRNRQQQQQQQQQQNKIKDSNNKQQDGGGGGGGNIGNGGICSNDGSGVVVDVKQIKYIPGNLNPDDLYALPNKINHQIHHRNNANTNANANANANDDDYDDDNNDNNDNDIISENDNDIGTIKTTLTKTTLRSKTATRKNLKEENYEIENANNDNDGIGLNVGVGDDDDEDDEDEDDEEKGKKEEIEGIEDKDINKDLPPGWEKHEDNDGPYYWHIKSGTIQREPPTWPKCNNVIGTTTTTATTTSGTISNGIKEIKTPIQTTQNSAFITATRSPNNNTFQAFYGHQRDSLGNRIQETQSLSVTRSSTSSALDQEEERRRREDITYKRRSYPLKSDSDRPIRFAVRSLGWVEIAEEDLTPERSSKAVNKCIVDLSLGRNDLLDVVGRWGDGKDLFMDLDEGALKLIDPENLTILNTQPIHTIRVWGVGRDNGRDFAYVARDRLTRIHMCHVFRCDTAARTIANTLRDICKRIMIERSLQLDANSSCMNANSNRNAIRPTDLPTENRKWSRHPQSFPTPMEEPKKILKAQYLGSREVPQATGMDILNNAIETVLIETKPEQWENVNVSVAPSMISVHGTGEDARLLAECRVRYLSFLGIGKNVKNCAFIMHTAQDKFVVHVFHCEPSSGALCKTIEAACKLRYQKCLDAHPENRLSSESNTPSKGIGATIKNLMSSLTLKKDKASS